MSNKVMNLDVLDILNAIESEMLDEIKNIDSKITELRQTRKKLSDIDHSINPTTLCRQK